MPNGHASQTGSAMRSAIASAVLTALALVALPGMPASVQASTGVLRCEMPDGSRVYTNKACTAFGAKSLPMPGELRSRIASETRYEATITGDEETLQALAAANTPLQAPVRRSVAAGCAGNPQQLASDLQGAIAMGDVNRVAESYHWVGMDGRQAKAMMQRLEQLASRPVSVVQYFDAHIGMDALFADASASASSNGNAGMLQLTSLVGETGSSVTDFNVVRYAGCYFVNYA